MASTALMRPTGPAIRGRKVFRHREVGELDISYDVFEMPGEPGLSIASYTAEEGTPSADKLGMLASWAAAEELGSKHRAPDAHRRSARPPGTPR